MSGRYFRAAGRRSRRAPDTEGRIIHGTGNEQGDSGHQKNQTGGPDPQIQHGGAGKILYRAFGGGFFRLYQRGRGVQKGGGRGDAGGGSVRAGPADRPGVSSQYDLWQAGYRDRVGQDGLVAMLAAIGLASLMWTVVRAALFSRPEQKQDIQNEAVQDSNSKDSSDTSEKSATDTEKSGKEEKAENPDTSEKQLQWKTEI